MILSPFFREGVIGAGVGNWVSYFMYYINFPTLSNVKTMCTNGASIHSVFMFGMIGWAGTGLKQFALVWKLPTA